jgi:sRNA-binding protein
MNLQRILNRKAASKTRGTRRQHTRQLITWLLLLAFVVASFVVPSPATVYAAQAITIAPTQPVYLVNNGDTAYVGFRMTYTGTPAEGLDRDITLSLTTGTALQVGASPGNAQNVATALAGESTTIAGGSSTLAQGRGSLSAAAAIGATNIKVSSVTNMFIGQALNVDLGANLEVVTITAVGSTGSNGSGISFTPALTKAHSQGAVYAAVSPAGSMNIRVAAITNFAAGQMININSGAGLETATIAEVGGGGATTLVTAAASGATNIKVASVSGLVAGNKLWIGAGADQESAVIASVGTSGASGTGVTLASGLTKDHVSGSPVTGNILVLTSGLTLSHAVTTANAAAIPVVTLTPAGATNIKVVNVAGFVAGQSIYIDTGANQETATIAAVGTSGATGTGLDLTVGLTLAHTGAPAVVQTEPVVVAGATNIKVNNVMGYYPGDTVTVDTGINVERRTIVAVGTPGLDGTGIDLAPC